ncbi:MAG: Fe-S-containing hydro-lyase [Syntrophorhabdaceae bacterium]|nr:Fe-S-containing hydro-lyase [Syntrophorhabdaceae bacterium]
MEIKHIKTPLSEEVIEGLKSGDKVLLTGHIYTARDTAHKRFMEALKDGKDLPFDIRNQVIYYCGPSPAPSGRVAGSCGPTTSTRMDLFAPELIKRGLKGMIGKGRRSEKVKEAIREYKAVYFGAIGGAGALISRCVISMRAMAYEDLGPESIFRLEVKEMPLFVINDIFGHDLYDDGMLKYKR